jgi:hypothetical protein
MFGLRLENDEWLAVMGVSCLVLRLLFGIAQAVWCCKNDLSPSPMMGGIGILLLPNLTGIAVAATAVALFSILIGTGGLKQEFRVAVYTVLGTFGFFLGIVLEGNISFRLFKFSLWLGSFRVPRYREQLQSGNPAEKLAAAERLERLGPSARSASAELLLALHDESADVRAASLRALLSITPVPEPEKDREILSAARTALNDPDFRVHTAATALLSEARAIPWAEALPKFIDGLLRGDDPTVIVALRGLTLLGPDAASACQLVRDTILQRPATIAWGFSALQAIGTDAVPVLIEFLERGDFNSKCYAIAFVGDMGEPARAALPALRKIARDSSNLKVVATKAIRKLGGNAV